jgi:hypothetical protein
MDLPFQRQPVKARAGDECGCVTGARFLVVALMASSVWYAWHWHSSNLSFWGILLRILGWSFVAGILGKVVGIIVFRSRSRKPRSIRNHFSDPRPTLGGQHLTKPVEDQPDRRELERLKYFGPL